MAKDKEIASELTPEEIKDSIDLRPELAIVLDEIRSFEHLSHIREFRITMPRRVIENEFTQEELDVIYAVLNLQATNLHANSIGHVVVQEEDWSPSKYMSDERDPDWLERAANFKPGED